MKVLLPMILLLSFSSFAQEGQEGDLQLPVSDIEQIERQEEELPPTLDEVQMKQEDEKEKIDKKTKQKIKKEYETN